MNVNLSPFPVIKTERLLLRQLTIDDSYELLRLRSDDRVNKYLNRPKAISIAETEAFIKYIEQNTKANESVYWAISLKNDPKLIGCICFWNLDHEKGIAEIGYELSPTWQGQGIMQEAIENAITYGFEVMQAKIITALPYPTNKNSIRLLERNNFQRDLHYRYVSKEKAREEAVYFLIGKNQ